MAASPQRWEFRRAMRTPVSTRTASRASTYCGSDVERQAAPSAQAWMILDRVDDTAAELAERRAGAVTAVFFERARGEAEHSRGFMRPDEARGALG